MNLMFNFFVVQGKRGHELAETKYLKTFTPFCFIFAGSPLFSPRLLRPDAGKKAANTLD